MILTLTRMLDCDDPAVCMNRILAGIGHDPKFRLRAERPTDLVHGSITVDHLQPPALHRITVELYEAEAPPARGLGVAPWDHQTTLTRALKLPTDAELRARLQQF